MRLFTLTKLQFFGVVLYAAAFPLSGLINGKIQTILMFATAPFLPIGYLIGGLGWQLLGTQKAYPYGLFAGIFLQAWLLLGLWVGKKSH